MINEDVEEEEEKLIKMTTNTVKLLHILVANIYIFFVNNFHK